MKITDSKINGFKQLEADTGCILHRVGDKEFPTVRATVVPEDRVPDWEELSEEDVPKFTEAEYAAKTAELIRRRYSADDESAILRKAAAVSLLPSAADSDTGLDPERILAELADYNAYAEQCKAEAKETLANRDAETEAEPNS